METETFENTTEETKPIPIIPEGSLCYRVDDNGTIIDSAEFWYHDDCLITDKEIIRGWDKVLYIKGTEPQKPQEIIEQELEAQFSNAVTQHLNDFALQKQYDSIDTARLASLTTDFKSDGGIANQAYDSTWAKAIELMPNVMDATITVEDAVAQLPVLTWEES